MKWIGVFIGVVMLVGAFFLFSRDAPVKYNGAADNETQVTTDEEGDLLSDIAANLSFKDYDGNTVTFEDFSGKPLIINSWAAWCPFCRKELPAFAAVQKEFGEEVLFIAIDRAESRSVAKQYSDEVGVTDDMLFLLDPSDSFYRAIGGFSMPETIFVNKDGVIMDHKRGPMEVEEIRRRTQNIL